MRREEFCATVPIVLAMRDNVKVISYFQYNSALSIRLFISEERKGLS